MSTFDNIQQVQNHPENELQAGCTDESTNSSNSSAMMKVPHGERFMPYMDADDERYHILICTTGLAARRWIKPLAHESHQTFRYTAVDGLQYGLQVLQDPLTRIACILVDLDDEGVNFVGSLFQSLREATIRCPVVLLSRDVDRVASDVYFADVLSDLSSHGPGLLVQRPFDTLALTTKIQLLIDRSIASGEVFNAVQSSETQQRTSDRHRAQWYDEQARAISDIPQGSHSDGEQETEDTTTNSILHSVKLSPRSASQRAASAAARWTLVSQGSRRSSIVGKETSLRPHTVDVLRSSRPSKKPSSAIQSNTEQSTYWAPTTSDRLRSVSPVRAAMVKDMLRPSTSPADAFRNDYSHSPERVPSTGAQSIRAEYDQPARLPSHTAIIQPLKSTYLADVDSVLRHPKATMRKHDDHSRFNEHTGRRSSLAGSQSSTVQSHRDPSQPLSVFQDSSLRKPDGSFDLDKLVERAERHIGHIDGVRRNRAVETYLRNRAVEARDLGTSTETSTETNKLSPATSEPKPSDIQSSDEIVTQKETETQDDTPSKENTSNSYIPIDRLSLDPQWSDPLRTAAVKHTRVVTAADLARGRRKTSLISEHETPVRDIYMSVPPNPDDSAIQDAFINKTKDSDGLGILFTSFADFSKETQSSSSSQSDTKKMVDDRGQSAAMKFRKMVKSTSAQDLMTKRNIWARLNRVRSKQEILESERRAQTGQAYTFANADTEAMHTAWTRWMGFDMLRGEAIQPSIEHINDFSQAFRWLMRGIGMQTASDAHAAAAEYFTKAILADGRCHVAYQLRAVARIHLGQYEAALQDLDACLLDNPEKISRALTEQRTSLSAQRAESAQALTLSDVGLVERKLPECVVSASVANPNNPLTKLIGVAYPAGYGGLARSADQSAKLKEGTQHGSVAVTAAASALKKRIGASLAASKYAKNESISRRQRPKTNQNKSEKTRNVVLKQPVDVVVAALYNRALVFTTLGDLLAALDDLNDLLRLQKKHKQALLLRGLLRRRQGDAKGASDDYVQAASCPDSSTSKGISKISSSSPIKIPSSRQTTHLNHNDSPSETQLLSAHDIEAMELAQAQKQERQNLRKAASTLRIEPNSRLAEILGIQQKLQRTASDEESDEEFTHDNNVQVPWKADSVASDTLRSSTFRDTTSASSISPKNTKWGSISSKLMQSAAEQVERYKLTSSSSHPVLGQGLATKKFSAYNSAGFRVSAGKANANAYRAAHVLRTKDALLKNALTSQAELLDGMHLPGRLHIAAGTPKRLPWNIRKLREKKKGMRQLPPLQESAKISSNAKDIQKLHISNTHYTHQHGTSISNVSDTSRSHTEEKLASNPNSEMQIGDIISGVTDVYSAIMCKPTEVERGIAKPRGQRKHSDIIAIREMMEALPFFRDLEIEVKDEIARCVEYRRCTDGELICEEGEDFNYFVIIMSGEAVIRVNVPMGDQSTSVVVGALGSGDYFGELALLYGPERTLQVSSKGIGSQMLFLHGADFYRVGLDVAFDAHIEFKRNKLRRCGAFSHFADEDLLKLAGVAKVKPIQKHTTMIRQGDLPSNFYVLLKGICSVYRSSDIIKDIDKRIKDLQRQVHDLEFASGYHRSMKRNGKMTVSVSLVSPSTEPPNSSLKNTKTMLNRPVRSRSASRIDSSYLNVTGQKHSSSGIRRSKSSESFRTKNSSENIDLNQSLLFNENSSLSDKYRKKPRNYALKEWNQPPTAAERRKAELQANIVRLTAQRQEILDEAQRQNEKLRRQRAGSTTQTDENLSGTSLAQTNKSREMKSIARSKSKQELSLVELAKQERALIPQAINVLSDNPTREKRASSISKSSGILLKSNSNHGNQKKCTTFQSSTPSKMLHSEREEGTFHRKVLVETLYPPSIFGEAAILARWDGFERASFVAETYCEVLCLNKAQIDHSLFDEQRLSDVRRRSLVYPNDDDIYERAKTQKLWTSFKKKIVNEIDKKRWPVDKRRISFRPGGQQVLVES